MTIKKAPLLFAAACAGAALLATPLPAAACGCIAPPDPSVPVVQAGERILFAVDGGEVTAHIQIQYAGAAGDFGWLLPLPSVPKLELGVDEVFNQLITSTQPKYRTKKVYNGNCLFPTGAGRNGPTGPNLSGGEGDASSIDPKSPLVIQGSVGPYDYAVLHADKKDDMLGWLAANHFFVPAGTDDVVGPYIHPGAYFLALKLHPGQATGDLQPVVVRYASDLPMIPIVLSSVAAQRDMGIQVWMLGDARAIPRNYYHTVLNDAAIDWLTAGKNYNDVIIAATKEAPERHTFVTEYAGVSKVVPALDFAGRFGDAAELAAITDPARFTEYLLAHNFPLNGQVTNLLAEQIPMPSGISAANVSAAQYYGNLGYYLGAYRKQHPSVFERYSFDRFDPKSLADALFQRVAIPTRAAAKLFERFGYLTRLYTTLSPEQMDKDPVFSWNRDLPSVANEHVGTLTYECGVFGHASDPNTTYAWLRTADGFTIAYPDGTGAAKKILMPSSRRIEILREQGAPELLTDNTGSIVSATGSTGGCVAAPGATRRADLALALLGLLFVGLSVRRRGRA